MKIANNFQFQLNQSFTQSVGNTIYEYIERLKLFWNRSINHGLKHKIDRV